jgi:hypothetical protein
MDKPGISIQRRRDKTLMAKFIAAEDLKKGDVLTVEADGTVRKAPPVSTDPFFSPNMSDAEKQAAGEGLAGSGGKDQP